MADLATISVDGLDAVATFTIATATARARALAATTGQFGLGQFGLVDFPHGLTPITFKVIANGVITADLLCRN
ncbi:hypothetical protein [Dyella japonica]|uniref:hypothetical protein n=1 Tax=Dyella japonica TaxID=231455 RepID=UPI0011861B0C|nr:hypothetical protein [Dyella japonica]